MLYTLQARGTMRVTCIGMYRAVTRKCGVKNDVNTVGLSSSDLIDHVRRPCGRGRPMPGSNVTSLHTVLHTTLSCNGV